MISNLRLTKQWPDDLINRVAKMLADGLSSGQIGAELGVSRNAIIGRVRRIPALAAIGFKRKPGPDPVLTKHRSQQKQPQARRARFTKIAGVLAAPKAKGIHVAAVAAKREARASDPGTANLVRVPVHAATFDAGTRKVRLADLESGDCRWIVEGTGEAARFCALPVEPSRSWCHHHFRRAFQRGAA